MVYRYEFSKIYTRLMNLELLMKSKVISSMLPFYKEQIINLLYKFFTEKHRLERYNNKNGNIILSILRNNQTLAVNKFKYLINILYLSDILVLILNCKEFYPEEITNNFYLVRPEKFGLLIDAKENLTNLRNVIAHYNFKDYKKNRNNYLEALFLFEKHIGQDIFGIKKLPIFSSRPSIRNIIEKIAEIRPDLLDINIENDNEIEYSYNKHRILLDLCDDIAFSNGYNPEELPSPWTILREMYNFKKQVKETTLFVSDLPLFK